MNGAFRVVWRLYREVTADSFNVQVDDDLGCFMPLLAAFVRGVDSVIFVKIDVHSSSV